MLTGALRWSGSLTTWRIESRTDQEDLPMLLARPQNQRVHHHLRTQQKQVPVETRAPLPGRALTHPTRGRLQLVQTRMRPWATQVRQLRRRANRPHQPTMGYRPLPGQAPLRLRLQPPPGGQSNMLKGTIRRKTSPQQLRQRVSRLMVGKERLLVPAPPCLLQMPHGMLKQVGFFYEGETAR